MSLFKTPKLQKTAPPVEPPPPPVEPAPPPVEVSPDVEQAEKDWRKKLLKAKGRRASKVTTPGLLRELPKTERPTLKEKLG